MMEFELKEFSRKSLNFLKYSTAFLNIGHGAVRSSKTITATLRFLKHVSESEHTQFLQSGKTKRSLERNVLLDEMKMLNTYRIPYKHDRYDGKLTIGDKIIWLLGYRDERVSEVIRGMTIGGWYEMR